MSNAIIPSLPGTLLLELIRRTVEIPSPHVWNFVEVQILVDFNNRASTVLGGPMRDIGRHQVEHSIFGELADKGTQIVPYHIYSWLQKPGESRLV